MGASEEIGRGAARPFGAAPGFGRSGAAGFLGFALFAALRPLTGEVAAAANRSPQPGQATVRPSNSFRMMSGTGIAFRAFMSK